MRDRNPGLIQAAAVGGSAGFTLVEALIVIVMTGVVGGAFVSLLMTQDRFYSRLDDGIATEQSLRVATDLASTELRMGSPANLMAAQPDSVSIRFDLFRAVVCDVAGGNSVHLFVYDSAGNANLPASFAGTAYQAPYTTAFEFADGWTGTSASSGAAKSVCVGNAAPDSSPATLYRTVSGWTGNFPSGVPPRGSIVRRYGRLTYRLAPSGFGPGWALYRGSQELVGPLDPTSAFEYVMADSSVQSAVLPGDLPDIRIVRLNAVAIGEDPRFSVRRWLRFDVPLRN